MRGAGRHVSDDKGSPWNPGQAAPGQGGPGGGHPPYPDQGTSSGSAYPQNPGYPAYPSPAPGNQPAPGYGYPPGGQGYPPPGYGPYGGGPYGGGGQPRNGLGIAALVLGVLAILTCWTVIGGILLGVAALICGFLGRGRAKRQEATNGGMALAGIITGALGAVLAVIVLIAAIAFSDEVQDLQTCLDDAGTSQTAQDQCAQEFADDLNGK
ncbi:hypothetical protein FrEUN1fDRAFT_3931 [Parafrankia sp. EUN1f]|nr:hypothetical protein FrEUN1fDRAFT_3931 [Parafrankia sp. EUN1f]